MQRKNTTNLYAVKNSESKQPLISSVSSHTSEISRFTDYHLQPNVKDLKSYVKDTTDFINKIESQLNIPTNSFLVSMDVRSLYRNIPHKEGITAVKDSLERKTAKALIKVVLMFLKLIPTLNNFVFNSCNYLQIKGYATGTKCVPYYVNIFNGESRRDILISKNKRSPQFLSKYGLVLKSNWKASSKNSTAATQ